MGDGSAYAQELKALLQEPNSKKTSDDDTGSTLKTVKGLIGACLWVIFMVISTVSVQLLQKRIPDFELNAFRCGLPLVITSIGILVTRKWPVIERKEIISTSLYSILSFMCSIAIYVAATLLPLASVQSLSETANIITGIILFCIFLDDKPTILGITSALICSCGVILVIQPDFIFIKKESSGKGISLIPEKKNRTWNNSETTNMTANMTKLDEMHLHTEDNNISSLLLHTSKYALPIINGLSMTLDVIVVKKRPYLSDHIVEVLFWCILSNTAFSVIVMFFTERPVLPSNWYDMLLVISHCVSYLFIWPLYLYTVRRISGNTFVLISSTIVVFMVIAQYTVLSSILPGNGNWVEIAGVVLVLLGSTLGAILELSNCSGYKC